MRMLEKFQSRVLRWIISDCNCVSALQILLFFTSVLPEDKIGRGAALDNDK